MRLKISALAIITFSIILISNITQVKANPVILGYDMHLYLFLLFLLILYAFVITIFLENLIIRVFLRRCQFDTTMLFINVIKINLFTFAIAQLIALYFIFNRNYWYSENIIKYIFFYISIELIPFFLEFLLYFRFYVKSNRNLIFEPPVKIKTMILSTLTANIITIIIGLFLSNIIS